MSIESKTETKIPLKLSLEISEMDGDIEFYQFVIEVQGNEKATTVAIIAYTPGETPSVSRVEQTGLEVLETMVRDRLLIRLFKLAYNEMMRNDGTAIEWWLPDISGFLRRRFDAADAGRMAEAFAKHVNPAISPDDMRIIRID